MFHFRNILNNTIQWRFKQSLHVASIDHESPQNYHKLINDVQHVNDFYRRLHLRITIRIVCLILIFFVF